MAAVVLMAIVVLPMMGYQKYRKHKARKAMKKELGAQPEPPGGHQALWEQFGDHPPSYDDAVGSHPSPPYSSNRPPGYVQRTSGNRGLPVGHLPGPYLSPTAVAL
ncbi:hypothetical protein VC83_00872 [Pseudogymnoascus destructans]|uniref:Uncharacterized protein n=2 Tax=Pseudogymnoascus destructans TaxID=655981 RepID=L8FLA1_PSED2|nr:uncharacterized protein VC83_00872 [Pseudogymnoascus destructans]ELR01650.1 hypothetical protein GMDG_00026 [Pseudogymnoascus destructans 20631-21]OAF62780.1 hypothetical protein VC83_00872 [Pseudogymnoascus destructans]